MQRNAHSSSTKAPSATTTTTNKTSLFHQILDRQAIFVLLIFVLDAYRCYHSLNPNFFVDVDWHCYKEFGRLLWEKRELDYGEYVCNYGRMYYPVSFVYLYGLFWYITQGNSATIQLIHAIVNVVISCTTALVFFDFMKKHRYMFVLSVLGAQTIYRVAIGYATNDLHQTLFVVLMLLAIKHKRYFWSSLFFSLAVSYKMNALFYGPPLLFVYLHSLPFWSVFRHFFAMGMFQVLAPLPFLLQSPGNYLKVAFNFSRDFDHNQNLAWSFLGDNMRHQPLFYKALLCCTLFFMFICFYFVHRILTILKQQYDEASRVNQVERMQKLSRKITEWKIFTFIITNFIGFTFSRGVHVQFSLWIFYSLPYLLTRGIRLKSPLVSVGLFFLFDFCLAKFRNVIHLRAIPKVFSALISLDFKSAMHAFNGGDEAVFGKLLGFYNIGHHSEMAHYPLLGWYYREGYGPLTIPSSFVLFLMELFILYRVVGTCYQALRRLTPVTTKKTKVQ